MDNFFNTGYLPSTVILGLIIPQVVQYLQLLMVVVVVIVKK
jgi:hypothetical protein